MFMYVSTSSVSHDSAVTVTGRGAITITSTHPDDFDTTHTTYFLHVSTRSNTGRDAFQVTSVFCLI